jgi:anti-sigma regulatory factor (Ser/Thr protein kinase)
LRLVDPVRAATSELAANAIVHAQTPFTVTLSCSGSLAELRVDDGAVLTPVRPPVQGAVLVMAEGGRGLHIIAALSQDWGFATAANNTKSVWATFDAGRPIGGGDWS